MEKYNLNNYALIDVNKRNNFIIFNFNYTLIILLIVFSNELELTSTVITGRKNI